MSNTNQLRPSPRVLQPRVALSVAGPRTASIAARMTRTASTTTSGRGGLRSTTSAAAASSPRVWRPAGTAAVARTTVPHTAAARTAAARSTIARTAAARTAAAAITARTAGSVATFLRENTQRSKSTQTDTVEDKGKSSTVVPFANSLNTSYTSRNDVNCPICLMSIMAVNRRALATRCGHVFCDVCLLDSYSRKNVCPMCQQVMKKTDFLELFI